MIKIATDHRLGIPSQCFAAAKAGIGKAPQMSEVLTILADGVDKVQPWVHVHLRSLYLFRVQQLPNPVMLV